jgi:ferredoxin
MTTKATRKIVHINEEKCNGCGICVPSCAEGALKIINGKAKLVSEIYCDGLGACLGECPQGAITIEERAAEEFNELAAEMHHEMAKQKVQEHSGGCTSAQIRDLTEMKEQLPCGCSSAVVHEIERCTCETDNSKPQLSQLRHWPVQLTLLPSAAPFLKNADVVLAADCAAYAYADFHRDFLKNNALIIACPKLDDYDSHLDKLTQIIAYSGLKSLTVVHMEVPCCSGLVFMAKKAIEAGGKRIPFKEVTIGVSGDLKK